MERHRRSEGSIHPARVRRSRRIAETNRNHFSFEGVLPEYEARREAKVIGANHQFDSQKPQNPREFSQVEYVQKWLAETVQAEERQTGIGRDRVWEKRKLHCYPVRLITQHKLSVC